LNGKQGDIEILHEFTDYYKKVSLPNTPNADDRFQQEIDQLLCGSFSDDSVGIKFDIPDIIRSVKKLLFAINCTTSVKRLVYNSF